MSQHGTTENYFLEDSHEQPLRSTEADGASPLPLFFDPLAHLFHEGLAVGAASQRGVSKTEKVDPVSTKTRPRPTVRGRDARIRAVVRDLRTLGAMQQTPVSEDNRGSVDV